MPAKRPVGEIRAEFEQEFREASATNRAPKCQDHPDLYADYEHTPSKAQAAAMCEDCPLLEICREFALATKPAWTVLGGIAWNYHRQHEEGLEEK